MENAVDILWTAGFLNERFPAPVSPLGWSVIGSLFDEIALRDPLRFMGYTEAERIPATRLWRGHPYANALIFQIMYNPFPDLLLPADAIRYFPRGDVGSRRNAPYPRSPLNPRFLFFLAAHILRDPINASPFNYSHWDRYAHGHNSWVKELDRRLDAAKDPNAILEVLSDAYQVSANLLRIHRWSLTYADIFYRCLALFDGDRAQELISNVPNLTQKANRQLLSLAELGTALGFRLDSEEQVRKATQNARFSEALERVLRAHGHRSFSLDIAERTLRESPAHFLCILTEAGLPSNQPRDWKAVAGDLKSRIPVWQRPLFAIVLNFARRYAGMREDQRYHWQQSLAVSRRGYLRLAELLTPEVLEEPEDVFFATRDEISNYLGGSLDRGEFAQALRRRRDEWGNYDSEYAESASRSYPDFLIGDMPLEAPKRADRDNWEGRGISPGIVKGQAHVVFNARDLRQVARGEILVAPSTDPAWTPVFARISGLVVERGGVLAHAAIIAREHRLPAVSGLPNISLDIKTGDWLEIDGTRGIVKRLTYAPEKTKSGSSCPAA